VVSLKPPGRMRWTYRSPRRNLVSTARRPTSMCPPTSRSSAGTRPTRATCPPCAVRPVRHPGHLRGGAGVGTQRLQRLRLTHGAGLGDRASLRGRDATTASARSWWSTAGQPQPVRLDEIRENVGSRRLSGSGPARRRGDRGVKRLPVVLRAGPGRTARPPPLSEAASARSAARSSTAPCSSIEGAAGPPDKLDYAGPPRAKLRASEEHTVTGRRLLGRGLLRKRWTSSSWPTTSTPLRRRCRGKIESAEAQRRANAPAHTIDQIRTARASGPARPRPGARGREPLGLSFRGAQPQGDLPGARQVAASTSSSIPSFP